MPIGIDLIKSQSGLSYRIRQLKNCKMSPPRMFFGNELKAILPELFLLLGVSTLLLLGVEYSTSKKQGYPVVVKSITWMTAFTCLLGLLLVMNNPFQSILLFNNMLVHDPFTNLVKAILSTGVF